MDRRWPLFAAVGFAALFVLSQVVVPSPPDVRATGEVIVQYYRSHGSGLRLSVWLTTLSALPFVPLVALLRARLRGLGRDVMLIGAVGIASQTAVWTWITAGLALHPASLDPRTARTITDIGAYYGPVLTVAVVLFAAPIGLAAWWDPGAYPRWLAPLTGILVVEQLIETVTVFGKRGFIAPGGGMNLILGAVLFVIWVIAVGAGVDGRGTRSGTKQGVSATD